MKSSELTFKQEKSCYYIVSGLSLKDTSDYIGVTEQTLFRWLKLPQMQALIRELRRISIEHSLGELQRLNGAAIATLERNLTCGNYPSEVRAALGILTKNAESINFFEYESRLKAIEERFDER